MSALGRMHGYASYGVPTRVIEVGAVVRAFESVVHGGGPYRRLGAHKSCADYGASALRSTNSALPWADGAIGV